ncbi:MAG: FAD:protein FMN transferase [Candidatus Zixiibacteriota bacterium]
MTFKTKLEYMVHRVDSHWVITYSAMAGPCEILVRCKERSEVDNLASLALSETRRIENKFSRYRDDNIVYIINNGNGAPVEVDEEMAGLLNYAGQCYQLSDGLFDITSGVLRKAWKFDGSHITPDAKLIESFRTRIGWDKVNWDGGRIRLKPGMEIDLGGIGKEYAVDKVAEMLFQHSSVSLMVNFGGDIRAITADETPIPWIIGIEDPERENGAIGQIDLANGGVATSGDVRRFCYVNDIRMGHILNPRTGWPVVGAPRSATVLGTYCMEAGLLATLAMLNGAKAEEFLKEQKVTYHCIR